MFRPMTEPAAVLPAALRKRRFMDGSTAVTLRPSNDRSVCVCAPSRATVADSRAVIARSGQSGGDSTVQQASMARLASILDSYPQQSQHYS